MTEGFDSGNEDDILPPNHADVGEMSVKAEQLIGLLSCGAASLSFLFWALPALATVDSQAIPVPAPEISKSMNLQEAQRKAEGGDAAAQDAVGGYYFLRKQYDKSAYWFSKAAAQGDASGELNLGIAYAGGLGVAQDYGKAAVWLEKSAAQGNVVAEYLLGHMHGYGQGFPKDPVAAFKWYKKSAEQGYSDAEWLVGGAYLFGIGVQKDAHKAALWFQQAALQGNVHAEVILGELYAKGQGVSQDYGKAVHWFRMAAAQKDATAQYNLGCCYAEGLGVSKDLVKAYQWFFLSKQSAGTDIHIYKQALWYLSNISKQMTQKQINKALKFASDWQQRASGSGLASQHR